MWVKKFRGQGYRFDEISLLSFRADDSSAAILLQQRGLRIRPAWQKGEGIGYSSVHAFKGLENKIVILTDVRLGEAEFQRDLFYTGMTRATESVRILCDKTSQPVLARWMFGKGE